LNGKRPAAREEEMRRSCWIAAAALAAAVFTPAGPADSAATVKSVDVAGLKKAVAAHKGKVLLVNLWATWCGPCVAEFPDMVRLHKAYKSKGLEVLAVTVDEPEDRAKVVAFMQKQGAGFPALIRARGGVEAFVGAVDKAWEGAVPTTYIYNRAGKRIGKPHVGMLSYREFEAAIKPLL
jgi:thiol-disulfide isomerase/thioredoxin